MLCTVCKRNRAEVHAKKSRLIPNMQMILCNECLENKREPRFAIIIHGRENGFESVRSYIKDHRYVGDVITARELV